MTLPTETFRLPGISPKSYEHPADRAATSALGSIPMLDVVVKKLIEFGYERALRQSFLGSSVRLGPDQLGDVYQSYRQVLHVLDMPEEYDLYLTQQPIANAAAIGSGKPIIVVNSATVSLLTREQLQAVIAHEVGHILSEHVMYRTALMILLRIGTPSRLPLLGNLPLLGVRYALLEWFRASELTCDRAAALATRDPRLVCSTLMAIAGGAQAAQLDLDAFMRQGMEYTEGGSGVDRLQRLFTELNLTHALPVKRVSELMDWVRTGDYDRIIGGEYIRRGQEPPPRREAGDAVSHYSTRFRDFMKDAGDRVDKGGQQLGDWLRGPDDDKDPD